MLIKTAITALMLHYEILDYVKGIRIPLFLHAIRVYCILFLKVAFISSNVD